MDDLRHAYFAAADAVRNAAGRCAEVGEHEHAARLRNLGDALDRHAWEYA